MWGSMEGGVGDLASLDLELLEGELLEEKLLEGEHPIPEEEEPDGDREPRCFCLDPQATSSLVDALLEKGEVFLSCT